MKLDCDVCQRRQSAVTRARDDLAGLTRYLAKQKARWGFLTPDEKAKLLRSRTELANDIRQERDHHRDAHGGMA